jgi:hypothetical protein
MIPLHRCTARPHRGANCSSSSSTVCEKRAAIGRMGNHTSLKATACSSIYADLLERGPRHKVAARFAVLRTLSALHQPCGLDQLSRIASAAVEHRRIEPSVAHTVGCLISLYPYCTLALPVAQLWPNNSVAHLGHRMAFEQLCSLSRTQTSASSRDPHPSRCPEYAHCSLLPCCRS